MKRVRNFSEYLLLLESHETYGMEEAAYEKAVMKVKRCCSKILQKGDVVGTILSAIPVGISLQCEYFGTDGTALIFNPKNIIDFNDDEIIWSISQGIMHLALEHYEKQKNTNHSLWNLASDISAEQYLDGIGKSKLLLRYKNPIFNEKSVAEIYKMLQSGKYPVDQNFISFCEVLDPGDIDTDKITETIIGDINSVREDDEDLKDEIKNRNKKETLGDDNTEDENTEEETGNTNDEDNDENIDNDKKSPDKSDTKDDKKENDEGDSDNENSDKEEKDSNDSDADNNEDPGKEQGDKKNADKDQGKKGNDDKETDNKNKDDEDSEGDDSNDGNSDKKGESDKKNPDNSDIKDDKSDDEETDEETDDKEEAPSELPKSGQKVKLKDGKIATVKTVYDNGDIEI